MRRRGRSHAFEAPSLVPLADMLANTVGIMVFILVFAVLAAGGAVVAHPSIEQATTKKQIFAVCAHGRVLLLDLDRVERAVRREVGEPNSGTLDEWASRLEKARMEHDGYAVQGHFEFSNGFVPMRGLVQLRALPGSGEDARQAGRAGSAFLSALQKASPKDRFVYFFVYPDSIDVFERARELAKQVGFETGWYPKGSDETLSEVIWSVDSSEVGLSLATQ